MKLWPFAFFLFISAQASELNTSGFANCLSAPFDLPSLRAKYDFNDFDLLILFLAAYPGEKLPHVPAFLQTRAGEQWGDAFDFQGAALASDFLMNPPRTPRDAFQAGLSVCSHDVFCAALTIQNVLRTFGRYSVSINPIWFDNSREQWIAAIPSIQSSMISLRTDGGGNRFGEWYHVFGILAYSIDQMALGHSAGSVSKTVKLNDVLDKELTGNNEDPVKAQIDQDAVVMSWNFLGAQAGQASMKTDCSSASTYVTSDTRGTF